MDLRPTVDTDLELLAEKLERDPASEIVAWAWGEFADGCVLTASFQDCVLIDIAHRVAPGLEVVFLDTQYHFDETLDYVEVVRARYDLRLTFVDPDVPPDDRWRIDQNGCCRCRKVEPLMRVLDDRSIWITGARRVEAPTRAAMPVVGWDRQMHVLKVCPLAAWTDDDVAQYERDHELPTHPLRSRGYASIGCWPCTSPVEGEADPRAGRWAGSDKTECGLHLPPT